MPRVSQQEMVDRLVTKRGTVVVLGGIDTGKTTFALNVAEAARERGIPTAFIDADIGQSSVGPPTCIGIKFVNELERVDRETVSTADEVAFVGSTTPKEHLLPLVVGSGRLVNKAREAGSELIILDSTGFVSGFHAELLKYYKLDLIRPDSVVGFQRGGELDPVAGFVGRFFPADVTILKVDPSVRERSAEERLAYREARFKRYFEPPVSRWRVKTTVFMPAIPPETDLSRLDGLVVGLEDGKGTCLGIGVLEYDAAENILRMVSPVAEGAKGLRLGSMRITVEGRTMGQATYEDLFGSA